MWHHGGAERNLPLRIIIETIPHVRQRYDTCGDWQFHEITQPDGELVTELHVRVSKELGPGSTEAVILHELAEALLCRAHGVDEADVDDFDMGCESARRVIKGIDLRAPGFVLSPEYRELAEDPDAEPGDMLECPCRQEHGTAWEIEDLFVRAWPMRPATHDENFLALPPWNSPPPKRRISADAVPFEAVQRRANDG
jgi:hypothetical protein